MDHLLQIDLPKQTVSVDFDFFWLLPLLTGNTQSLAFRCVSLNVLHFDCPLFYLCSVMQQWLTHEWICLDLNLLGME